MNLPILGIDIAKLKFNACLILDYIQLSRESKAGK